MAYPVAGRRTFHAATELRLRSPKSVFITATPMFDTAAMDPLRIASGTVIKKDGHVGPATAMLGVKFMLYGGDRAAGRSAATA